MSRTALDPCTAAPAIEQLPLRPFLSQRSGLGISRALLVATAAMGFTVVLGGVALATVAQPSLGILAERPFATAQIFAGISLWLALLAVPATRMVSRIWVRRDVVIVDGRVEIRRRTPFATRTRSVPLSAYRGVAHHIRASLSGLTHEIVLVHAERDLTVTLVQAERVTQAMLDEAKSLLGLPEIPARAIYERASSAPQVAVGGGLHPAGA